MSNVAINTTPAKNGLKLAKASKSAKGAVTRAKKSTVVEVVQPNTQLVEQMTAAVKLYKSTVNRNKKLWGDYITIGNAAVALWDHVAGNKQAYSKAVADSPLSEIPSDALYNFRIIASNADRIAELRTEGTVTSYSPEIVRRQLAKLDKAQPTKADAKPAKAEPKAETKPKAKAVKVTDKSVAADIVALLKANPSLDWDNIVALVDKA